MHKVKELFPYFNLEIFRAKRYLSLLWLQSGLWRCHESIFHFGFHGTCNTFLCNARYKHCKELCVSCWATNIYHTWWWDPSRRTSYSRERSKVKTLTSTSIVSLNSGTTRLVVSEFSCWKKVTAFRAINGKKSMRAVTLFELDESVQLVVCRWVSSNR